MAKPTYRYEVWTSTTVDRPERRGPSFRPVAAGTRVRDTHRFATQGAALRCYREILAGGDDFSSEFIALAQAVRISVATDCPVRTVGAIVGRERDADGSVSASYTYQRDERVAA